MATILVIDVRSDVREWVHSAFNSKGFTIVSVDHAHAGVAIAGLLQPDVVLLGQSGDAATIDALRPIISEHIQMRLISIAEPPSTNAWGAGVVLGSQASIETPLNENAEHVILEAIALSGVAAPTVDCAHHAASRWANIIIPVVESPHDVRSLSVWARYVAASTGTIRNWCRISSVSPKGSLKLCRMLRAVVQHQRNGTPPEELFDIIDRRTLVKLCALGRPVCTSACVLPENPESLLSDQRWVTNPIAIEVLVQMASERGLLSAVRPQSNNGGANAPVVSTRDSSQHRRRRCVSRFKSKDLNGPPVP